MMQDFEVLLTQRELSEVGDIYFCTRHLLMTMSRETPKTSNTSNFQIQVYRIPIYIQAVHGEASVCSYFCMFKHLTA